MRSVVAGALLGMSLALVSAGAAAQEEKPAEKAPDKPAERPLDKPGEALTAPLIEGPPVEAKPVRPPEGRFEFGSYGRVRIGSDLRGGTARPTNIVSFGSRLDEDSYAELELRREDLFKDAIRSRVVTTLALLPPFFHFTGDATQRIALRNLYAQGQYERVTMWAGSRMYRGDDIYLLNLWPLDNQNTIGGGAGIALPGDTLVALHVGMQRLDDPYQYQTIPSVAPIGFGAVDTIKVDRPRIVESLKVTHFLRNGPGRTIFRGDDGVGLKFSAYGEAHQLSAGVQRDTLTNRDRALPDDYGFLVGAQVGYWTGVRDTFAHIFVRYANGIAAYDPLSVPTTFANNYTTQGASQTRVAIGGNVETGMLGVQWGGYLQFFRDASEAATSAQKYDEGALVVRPSVFIGEHFGVALEGSYQKRRYALPGVDGEGTRDAGLARFGIIPYFSPSGRGSYRRPQLRIIYTVSRRDEGARGLYPADDVFSRHKTEHLLGVGAEWWFNSSSYP